MANRGKHTNFNKNWQLQDKYSWLQEVQGNPHLAFCTLCDRTFSLSNMGQTALKSHMEGKKHKNVVAEMGKTTQTSLTMYCKPVASTSSNPSAPATESHPQPPSSTLQREERETELEEPGNKPATQLPQPSGQARPLYNMNQYIASKEVKKAEILWALKSVLSHFSYNVNNDISTVLKTMFPDSEIARKFTLGATKLSYLICFGIAPYFKQKLIDDIRNAPCYVVCFDESLNKVCGEEQMDVVIRFAQGRRIVSRYLISKFMGHTTASDILAAFKDATKDLNQSRMLQISMDGPSTNFKFLSEIVTDRNHSDADMPKLLEFGSCSLHTVHGALSSGLQKAGWELDRLLRALFYLFDNAPARREDYTVITKSQVFPLQFCSTRWVEDMSVAERAIGIWPDVVKYVTEIQKKKRSQIPTSNSFQVVASAARNDSLVIAKLETFVSLARLLKPFLVKYQTDQPMMMFLAADIEQVVRDLLQRVLKQTVLAEATTTTKLINIDLKKDENLMAIRQVDIGFGAKNALEQIPEEKLSPLKKLDFYSECRKMIITMVEKLLQKSPLKYAVVRGLVSLDPRYMVSHPQSAASQFRRVLEHLGNCKWRTHHECDELFRQYRALTTRLQRDNEAECKAFSETKTRLDDFYFDVLNLHKAQDLKELWNVILMLLTLSHGQASVERGFSVNKDILAPNLKKESLIAQRLVHNALTCAGTKSVADFHITQELLQSCSCASSRYHSHLDDQRKEKEKQKEKRKRAELEEQLDEAIAERKELEGRTAKLIAEADKQAKQAESKKDFHLLTSSNALRKRAKLMLEKDIPDQDKKIEKMRSQMQA